MVNLHYHRGLKMEFGKTVGNFVVNNPESNDSYAMKFAKLGIGMTSGFGVSELIKYTTNPNYHNENHKYETNNMGILGIIGLIPSISMQSLFLVGVCAGWLVNNYVFPIIMSLVIEKVDWGLLWDEIKGWFSLAHERQPKLITTVSKTKVRQVIAMLKSHPLVMESSFPFGHVDVGQIAMFKVFDNNNPNTATRQFHIRVFDDGQIRGHLEWTPNINLLNHVEFQDAIVDYRVNKFFDDLIMGRYKTPNQFKNYDDFSALASQVKLGMGVVDGSNSDIIKKIPNSRLSDSEVSEKAKEYGHLQWNIKKYPIISWLPKSWNYSRMFSKIEDVVTKPSYNEAEKKDIEAGQNHPFIIKKAREIARDTRIDGHDAVETAIAVQIWHINNVGYVFDGYNSSTMDTYLHPYLLIGNEELGIDGVRAGDCDDMSMSVCSMLRALGHRGGMMVIGQDKDNEDYNHIFPVLILTPQEYVYYKKLYPEIPSPKGNKARIDDDGNYILPLEVTPIAPHRRSVNELMFYMPKFYRRKILYCD